jgi:hypothetical protein
LAAAGADLRAPEVDEAEDEAEGHQGHQQAQDDQDALQRGKIDRECGFLSLYTFLVTVKHKPKGEESEYPPPPHVMIKNYLCLIRCALKLDIFWKILFFSLKLRR